MLPTEAGIAADPPPSSRDGDARPAPAAATPQGPRSARRSKALILGLAVLLALGVVATAARIVRQYQPPGPFDASRQGYCDFHNGIYFPSLAWRRGESPYGQSYADRYPVARQIPFFSPVILMLHAPLTVLPLRVAEVLYFLFSIAVVAAIAWLAVRAAVAPTHADAPPGRFPVTAAVLAVAAGIVYSRGGHITLFDGYFTLLLVLATLAAVHWAQPRPWLSAAALVVVSAKPTYILPLGFLMLARGNFRAVVAGGIASATLAAIGFGWLAYHEGDGRLGEGFRRLQTQIATTQEIHRGQADESPVYSWTRLDLFSVVAKWTGSDPGEAAHLAVMAGLLIVPCAVLAWRGRAGRDDGVAGLTGAVLLSAMLVSLYHQSYDALLLVAPVTGLALGCQPVWRSAGWRWRLALAALMLVPAYNYLSTRMVLSRIDVGPLMHRLLTSVNGVALAAVLLLTCIWAWQTRRGATPRPEESASLRNR